MARVRTLLFSSKLAPYVFIAPFLLIFIVFRVIPTIYAVVISLDKFEGTDDLGFTGLLNYQKVLSNPALGKAFSNTVLYTLGTLLVLIPIPLVLAALLDSGRVVKRTVFRVALFLPALTSLVVVSVIFRIVLSNDGLLNVGLSGVGLGDERLARDARASRSPR